MRLKKPQISINTKKKGDQCETNPPFIFCRQGLFKLLFFIIYIVSYQLLKNQ